MLRKIYQLLPFSDGCRLWIKNQLPLAWRRDAKFREYGVINELYFWRTDKQIETVVPIQNFYSNIYPNLDTRTEGYLWIYDKNGVEIAQSKFSLPHNGMHVVRIGDYVTGNQAYGTFMWHIRMPDTVATNEEVKSNLIYFTDRGYICYEKNGAQPCFIHGVDRYAVFQKQDVKESDLFYGNTEIGRSWLPEFPLNIQMQEEIDVVLLNRSASRQEFTVTVHKNGGKQIFKTCIVVSARGAGVCNLNNEILTRLDGAEGYFLVDGLATHWGRPAIMRYFKSGSLSVMHC